jgi:hypothetical protein
MSAFEEELSNRKKDMFRILDSIDIDSLKSEGISLTFGGKTFKFTELEVVENTALEEKIRKEFRERLNEQQQRIREKINAKINQLLVMQSTKAQELERKEQELIRKYRNVAAMPEITTEHLAKGLSVARPSYNERDKLCWLYACKYNPKFIKIREGRKKLPDDFVNRMTKDIVIKIETKSNSVVSVEVMKYKEGRIDPFDHYHKTVHGGDCWGKWTKPSTWNTPDDIIRIAKAAEAVLETVNGGSVAKRGPEGLPKYQTLLNHTERLPLLDRVHRNINSDTSVDFDDEDVWNVD